MILSTVTTSGADMETFIADLPRIPDRVELVDALRDLIRLAAVDWSIETESSVIEHPSLTRARKLIGE